MAVVENRSNNFRIKPRHIVGTVGNVLTVGMAVSTYSEARNAGHGRAYSAAKAGAEFAAWELVPAIMMGKMMGEGAYALGRGAKDLFRENQRYVQRGYQANFGGNFIDSQGASTMRQAGMYNIQQSLGSLRGIGNEAKSYYKTVRRYY